MKLPEPEIFTCDQNTPEWHEARRGIVTASRFKDVMAKGQGKTRTAYLYTLAGEILTGECTEGFTNKHTERGHEYEDDARRQYAFEHDVDPLQIGFIRRGRVGCSPDGLVGDDGMHEVKSKLPHLQIDVLERDRVPPEHIAQIQGQIWIADREWCDFISYWPKLPLFVKRVHRDDEYIKGLSEEVERFLSDLDSLVNKYSVEEAA